MPRQANIVSFDAARRAATGTRASERGSAGTRGRILIGGDQSAIVKDRPAPGASFLGADVIPMPRRHGAAHSNGTAAGSSRAGRAAAPRRGANPTPSWYDGPAADRRDDVFARPVPARSASRFADDDIDADYDASLEEALDRRQGQGGAFARMRSRSAEKRRERTKERADRAYFRQYEAGKAADAAQGGPRAAVYKGEMGSSHKRSSRMQQTAAPDASGRRGRCTSAEKGPFFTRAPFMGFAATVFCLVFAVGFLYGPAQQLYVDIRERDRLAAEYEAVVQRNEAIGQQVSALQTDAGIEDIARTQLGWVREGEHAVSVSGLDLPKKSDFRGNIVSEDIELPDTWYSGVLDPIFGVK